MLKDIGHFGNGMEVAEWKKIEDIQMMPTRNSLHMKRHTQTQSKET